MIVPDCRVTAAKVWVLEPRSKVPPLTVRLDALANDPPLPKVKVPPETVVAPV